MNRLAASIILSCIVATLHGADEFPPNLAHVEVVYSGTTTTTYRFKDGTGTAIIDTWRGASNTRERIELSAPPTSSDGWAIVRLDFDAMAWHKPGLLLLKNGTGNEAVITVAIKGLQFAAVVPPKAMRIAIGPATWNGISERATITVSAPAWQQHERVKVVTVGSP